MKINQHDKKYLDARGSVLYVTKFTDLEHLEHTHEDIISSSYDDILAALTANQMLFENTTGFWELTQPEKIIEVELDTSQLFIFHTTRAQITIDHEENSHHMDIGDSPGMIIFNDQPIEGDGVMLPGTHGFIKIDSNITLKLGEISIELEHN